MGTAAPASFDFATTNAAFTVDGKAVSLTTDVTNMAGLVSNVQGQLDTAAPGTYSVGVDATTGGLSISKVATGVASDPALPPLDTLEAPKVDPFTLNGSKVIELMTQAGLL